MVAYTTELDLVLEFGVSQNLAADRVAPCVGDNDGIGGNVDDTSGKASLELAMKVEGNGGRD